MLLSRLNKRTNNICHFCLPQIVDYLLFTQAKYTSRYLYVFGHGSPNNMFTTGITQLDLLLHLQKEGTRLTLQRIQKTDLEIGTQLLPR